MKAEQIVDKLLEADPDDVDPQRYVDDLHHWVIFGPCDDPCDELTRIFWSNHGGWVDMTHATRFFRNEADWLLKHGGLDDAQGIMDIETGEKVFNGKLRF